MALDQRYRSDDEGPGWQPGGGGMAPGKRTRVPPLAVRSPDEPGAADDAADDALDERPAEAPEAATSPDDADTAAVVPDGLGDTAMRPPDLQSPRFAGEAQLEACYDDRARLTLGARGPAVQKVQAALVELGYSVGPQGADGVYRQGTWDAVKRFKAAEKLGWETMGDVGPGTMGRLDKIFSTPGPKPTPKPGGPRPRATEGEDPSAMHFVVTHTDDEPVVSPGAGDVGPVVLPPPPDPALIASFLIEAPVDEVGGEKDAVAPVGAGAGHLSIAQAVAKFRSQSEITDAQKRMGFDANTSQVGQFFWSEQVGYQVLDEINALAADPAAAAFAGKAKAAWDQIWGQQTGAAALTEAGKLAAAAKGPLQGRMLALLRGFTSGGATIEAQLWEELKKAGTNKLPDLSKYRSLVSFRTLRSFDAVGCTVHALRMARRVKDKGGVTPTSGGKSGFAGATLATGAGTRDTRTRLDATFQLGDVVHQSGAGAAAAGIRKALDAGELIHARVVSGVGLGAVVRPTDSATPHPIAVPMTGEHTILIIGYDGDTFVFSDPDAGVSHTPEAGFGLLHYDAGNDRLSTARDNGEMPVGLDGKHARGDKRYQILYVAVVS